MSFIKYIADENHYKEVLSLVGKAKQTVWIGTADFVFVLAVGYKLFPWLKLPAALWIIIGLIALVKASNAVSVYIVKHSQFLHTKANKLTGFLLFIGMMAIGQSYFILVAWVVACIALFAAIQEGHFIRSKKRIHYE